MSLGIIDRLRSRKKREDITARKRYDKLVFDLVANHPCKDDRVIEVLEAVGLTLERLEKEVDLRKQIATIDENLKALPAATKAHDEASDAHLVAIEDHKSAIIAWPRVNGEHTGRCMELQREVRLLRDQKAKRLALQKGLDNFDADPEPDVVIHPHFGPKPMIPSR